MQALLVDDELNALDSLEAILDLFAPEVEVVDKVQSLRAAVDVLRKETVEVVFLDINMGPENGFDLLLTTNSSAFEIIFVTAYREYAIEALRAGAIDYLLKPVNPDELVNALKKVKAKREQAAEAPAERIVLPGQNEKLVIDPIDIERIESKGNYSNLFLQDGTQHIVTRKLIDFERRLNPKQFLRVHRSHLVHLKCIRSILKQDGGGIVMQSGFIVPLGQGRKKEVMEMLEKHLDFL